MSIVSMQAFAYISMWGIYSSLVSSSGLLPPSSLSSAIPRVFLMNLCRSMLLRHPVGFDGYLAGISLSSCTLFSVANIGADMLRIPLCLIEHVGILHISMFASSTQFVWFLVYVSAMQNVSPARCSRFVNCRHLCENRIRPKSQCSGVIIIIK